MWFPAFSKSLRRQMHSNRHACERTHPCSLSLHFKHPGRICKKQQGLHPGGVLQDLYFSSHHPPYFLNFSQPQACYTKHCAYAMVKYQLLILIIAPNQTHFVYQRQSVILSLWKTYMNLKNEECSRFWKVMQSVSFRKWELFPGHTADASPLHWVSMWEPWVAGSMATAGKEEVEVLGGRPRLQCQKLGWRKQKQVNEYWRELWTKGVTTRSTVRPSLHMCGYLNLNVCVSKWKPHNE